MPSHSDRKDGPGRPPEGAAAFVPRRRASAASAEAPAPHPLMWLLPFIGAFLLLGYLATRELQPQSIAIRLALGGKPPAPEFSLARFDGGTLALSEFRGRYVILNVWASWCGPCRKEAPHLERAWRTYRERSVVVIGVSTLDRYEPARQFVAEMGLTFPNVFDPHGIVYRRYQMSGVPATFFIDQQGQIVQQFPGAYDDWRVWDEAIRRLLSNR